MKNTDDKFRTALFERDLQRLSQLRLMDDDFFSEVLDGKIVAVEFILHTILERTDVRVRRTAAQVEYRSAVKRSIKLDIWAEDFAGRIMDIEIQRADRGSEVKRARYHSSMIDRALLSKGEDFEDLSDTYVIFITENDKFAAGKPLYHIERTIEELGNTSFGGCRQTAVSHRENNRGAGEYVVWRWFAYHLCEWQLSGHSRPDRQVNA